jgi:hypothetical protein
MNQNETTEQFNERRLNERLEHNRQQQQPNQCIPEGEKIAEGVYFNQGMIIVGDKL